LPHDPDKRVMEKAFASWAPVYHALCEPVFLSGAPPQRRTRSRRAHPVDRCRHRAGVRRLRCLDRDHRHRPVGARGLECSRTDCREFEQRLSWAESAHIFLEHVLEATKAARSKPGRIAT